MKKKEAHTLIEQVWELPTDHSNADALHRYIDELNTQIDQAFGMLELNGVPKTRSRYVSNGIDVLVTRMAKENNALRHSIVSEFNEDIVPIFDQGYPTHEMQTIVTAERCTWMVDKIRLLSEWSIVADNPPTEDGWYLTYTEYPDFESKGWQTAVLHFEDGKFESGGKTTPTHWMYKPERPRK